MSSDRRRWALLAAAVFCCQGAAPAAAPQKVIARIDLSKPFHLPAGATFIATQGPDVPDPIFPEQFGRNNNQEVRYVRSGLLKGSMIAVQPTDNAPFGYWITIGRLTGDYRYQKVLRYRSATHYNDGNSLAVIDSEMPNILRR